MLECGVNHLSSILTFSNPCVCEGCPSSVMEGWSTSILRHIGMAEEDELEVFVDALDDKSILTSMTLPCTMDDNAMTLLSPNRLHPIS